MKRTSFFYGSTHFWSGFLFGVGLVSFLDEAIFHQFLHWHHFYDLSTTEIGLIADGLFHAFSWFATVVSLFLLADLRRRKSFVLKQWIGSAVLGTGFFQLYDGIIQHKVLRIHQIRYGVDVLPYDITWNVIAIVLIIIGIFLMKHKRKARKGI